MIYVKPLEIKLHQSEDTSVQNDVTVNPFSELCCVWHLSLAPTMALLQPVGVLLTDLRGPVGGGVGPTHSRETLTMALCLCDSLLKPLTIGII